jgi:hypothetical protein
LARNHHPQFGLFLPDLGMVASAVGFDQRRQLAMITPPHVGDHGKLENAV